MKKVLLITALVVSLACTTVYAGGAGNCVRPIKTTSKYLGVGAAFEYNYVDRRMNKLDNKHGAGDMEIKQMSQVYGKGIIGLGDYVNLYGKVGRSNYDLKFMNKSWPAEMKIELDDGIYTGGGLNALFPLMDMNPVSFGIGFDIQGSFFLNKVNDIKVDRVGATSIGGSFYGADGHNSLYLTCRYDIDSIKTSLIPYLGGYHSWMVVGTAESLTYDVAKTGFVTKDFQGAFDVLSFGVLVGVDVDIAKYINLNVEGRFIGETAITTGATIKF